MQQDANTLRRGLSRRLPALVGMVLLVLFFGFEVYVLIAQREGDSPLPPHFGNFQANRNMLEHEPKKEEFSFVVVGDTRSVGTFERIVEQLRLETLDFGVLLGDCSYKGTERDHRFFRAECAHEYALPFPVFYVVGNHDVSLEEFPISRFEEMYGPTNFTFEYQDCLFVVLRILNPPFSNGESIAFLREIVAKPLEGYRRRFAFMHIPPPISPDFDARESEGSAEVVSLLEEAGFDYVFAGDYHGYARVELGNTNYVVTGGGGAHLKEKISEQFHHAMVIRITNNSISERIVPAGESEEIEDRLEKFAITGFYPWMSENKAVCWGLNALGLALLLLLGWCVVRKRM